MDDIGKLTPLDERLDHQIADTFATIVESDIGWTEKIWTAIARKDGSLSISFGLGKYHNRNVMDGFGGISRGAEQWTVRASRSLSPRLQDTDVGPVRYEIVEPLKKVRFALDRNKTQPIAFDILFEGELPPFFEKRSRLRAGNRVASDIVRYQQAGRLTGWFELDGERHEINPDDWYAVRDHSWGMRGHAVGAHVTDLQPQTGVTRNLQLLWSPALMVRPDGSRYQLMHFLYRNDNWSYFSGHLNSIDAGGNAVQKAIRHMEPDFRFDTTNRQFLGGEYSFIDDEGESHRVRVTPLGPSGFYLRTGNYGGWKGGRHGSWRGEYHEDGEYFADIRKSLREIGQLRDLPVRVECGDDVGFGIQESMYHGDYPELGLTADSDFSSDL